MEEDGELGLLLAQALDPHPSRDSHQAARDLGSLLTARLTVRVRVSEHEECVDGWTRSPNSTQLNPIPTSGAGAVPGPPDGAASVGGAEGCRLRKPRGTHCG